MATYAIGDVQGCLCELKRLLDRCKFDPSHDRLWFVGDLVNRGPRSLETLRFVRSMGKSAITVLGNHDLGLLAKYAGVRPLSRGSSLRPVIAAKDCDDLMHWLRRRPLLHHDEKLGVTMVHAGIYPRWKLSTARECAQEVEKVLHSGKWRKFLANMYGDKPRHWDDTLKGWERLRFITNVFTRMRYCDPVGRLDLEYNGRPGSQPKKLRPWFDVPDRRHRDTTIVFGHWSTLGLYKGAGVIGLDTGCVWGGRLTAVRLKKRASEKFFQYPCKGAVKPG